MRTEHNGQSLNNFCRCPPPLSTGKISHSNFQDTLYTQTLRTPVGSEEHCSMELAGQNGNAASGVCRHSCNTADIASRTDVCLRGTQRATSRGGRRRDVTIALLVQICGRITGWKEVWQGDNLLLELSLAGSEL